MPNVSEIQGNINGLKWSTKNNIFLKILWGAAIVFIGEMFSFKCISFLKGKTGNRLANIQFYKLEK